MHELSLLYNNAVVLCNLIRQAHSIFVLKHITSCYGASFVSEILLWLKSGICYNYVYFIIMYIW